MKFFRYVNLFALAVAVSAPAFATLVTPGGIPNGGMPRSLGGGSRIMPGQMLIRLKRGVDVGAFLKSWNLALLSDIPELETEVVSVPVGEEWASANRYNKMPEVTYAEPNGKAYALSVPNDPLYQNYQWYMPVMNLADAWNYTTGSSSVVIAVLDTGVDTTHPDLKSKLVSGYDFVSNDNDPTDKDGHGTHVSGLAAAASNNSVGIAGMAWGAMIMPLRVLNAAGEGDDATIAKAMTYAADHGAKIINMSLGASVYDSTLANAVKYAQNKNCLVVAAAGNDYQNGNPVDYPAGFSGVLAVGASNDIDQHAYYSESGSYVSVVAPGGEPVNSSDSNIRHWIVSTWRVVDGGGYMELAGTSQSAPLASGLAALIWSLKPDYTATQVRQVITSTAKDIAPAGKDNDTGYGRIDAAAAVESLISSPADTTPPTVTITFPANGAVVSGSMAIQGSVQDASLKSFQVQYAVNSVLAQTWYNLGSLQTQAVQSGKLGALDTTALDDGDYGLRITATDLAGNATTFGPISFTIDNSPPDVSFSSPIDGATVSSVFSLSGSVNDAHLSRYVADIGSGENPEAWTNLFDVTPQSTLITGVLGQADLTGKDAGLYAIRLSATDQAGNTAQTVIHVTYQPFVPGDVNEDGVINVQDAILIMRMSIGAAPITDLSLADVAPVPGTNGKAYGDGRVTVSDAIRVLRRSLGLEPNPWPA